MNRHLSKGLSASLLLVAAFISTGAMAASLNDIYQVAERINDQAKQSQARIDALTDETRQLLNEYKTVLKEIEGLRVYNGQLDRQIENQETEMTQLTRSIDEVTVVERQVTPLMMRMIDGLDQFVELDLPFLLEERRDRVSGLREMMDRADVTVAEKFSQIMSAYQVENEYGRTMEAYTDTLSLGDAERQVDILKVGRIVLVYQSPDGEVTGFYNPVTSQWEELDDSYNTSVRNGIRMARQQLSPDMMIMPVRGPEAVPGPQGTASNQAGQGAEAAE